jgi:hypothetical protein
MTLIPDWRHAWRFHTVIFAAGLACLNALVANAPSIGRLLSCPELMAALGATLTPAAMHQVNVWTPVVLIGLRLLQQNIPARDLAAVTTEPPAAAPPSSS